MAKFEIILESLLKEDGDYINRLKQSISKLEKEASSYKNPDSHDGSYNTLIKDIAKLKKKLEKLEK
jgi:hypothetical protein